MRAIDEHRGVVSAAVERSSSYVVKLWMEGVRLAHSCRASKTSVRSRVISIRCAPRNRNFMRMLSRA